MPSPDPEIVPACPQCGAVPPPGSPAGHCAVCLGRAAFAFSEGEEIAEPAAEAGQPWAVLGGYELMEEIGRGGMGVVYKARQRKLGRTVAVKVLRGGALADGEARRRFQAEAEHAAALQHPGIVSVFDAGEEQGVWWLAMEYVAGRSLDDLVRHQPLTAREAAECVQHIAAAVAHAHAAGILHRDLKPSNIIMDADGAPHVTDFGIARRMDAEETAARLTRSGQILGSPGYTAPEQITGRTADARTDVYGLGGILYHVLTGRPPFQGATLETVLMQVRERDPLPPRSLAPGIPRDLETICLRALAREPARRYPSAREFGEDVQRFLEGKPVRARPVSPLEKAWRWCRRRPAVAAALTFAVLALVAGTVISLLLASEARKAAGRAGLSEARARRAAEDTRRALYSATMLRVQDDLQAGSPLAAGALAKQIPEPGATDLRGWEWHWLHGQLHQGTLRLDEKRPGEPRAVAWSPDGKRLAVSTLAESKGRARSIQIRDAETFAVIRTLTGYDREVPWLHWHPDNVRLLAGDAAGCVSVWDTESGERLLKLPLDPVDLTKYQPPRALWSPDGRQFAACSWRTGLTLHEASDGRLVRTLLEPKPTENAFAWHPSGDRIAVFNAPEPEIIILSTDGTRQGTLPLGETGTAIAWSPDGARLAAGIASSRLSIFDPEHPESAVHADIGLGAIGHLLWTGDGRRVVNGGWTGVPAVIDAASGRVERYLYGHSGGWITSMAQRGHRLLTWCKDGTLREWNLDEASGTLHVPGAVTRLQLSGPQQEIRADAHRTTPFGRAAIWQEDGKVRAESYGWARAIAWHPDGSRFALIRNLDPARYGLGTLMKAGALIEFRTAAAPGVPALPLPIRKDYSIHEALWSPDGTRLLVISAGSRPPFSAVLSAEDGQELCRIPSAPGYNLSNAGLAGAAAWSPDGKLVALGTGRILYDAATGQPASPALTASMERFAKEVGGPIISLAWSPDGARLAFGFADSGHVLVTDANSGEWLALQPVHSGWVRALAFSPDGTRLATCSRDTTVKLLEARTLDTLLIFRDHPTDVRAVTWSADGRTLTSASSDGRVLVRRLP